MSSERAKWFGNGWTLACFGWLAFALVSWSTVVLSSEASLYSGSTITALALLMSIVGGLFRMQAMGQAEYDRSGNALQLSMMLGLAATVNWLGFLCLKAGAFYDVVPALLIFLATEYWLDQKLDCYSGFWVTDNGSDQRAVDNQALEAGTASSLAASVGPTATANTGHSTMASLESPVKLPAESALQDETASPAENALPAESAFHDGAADEAIDRELEKEQVVELADQLEPAVRRSIESRDLDGRRFLSGEVSIKLVEDQKTEEVVVGFCPPFHGIPDVEFESTDENISARLANCTATGMRLQLRRARAEAEIDFSLEWYAAQSQVESSDSGTVPRILP